MSGQNIAQPSSCPFSVINATVSSNAITIASTNQSGVNQPTIVLTPQGQFDKFGSYDNYWSGSNLVSKCVNPLLTNQTYVARNTPTVQASNIFFQSLYTGKPQGQAQSITNTVSNDLSGVTSTVAGDLSGLLSSSGLDSTDISFKKTAYNLSKGLSYAGAPFPSLNPIPDTVLVSPIGTSGKIGRYIFKVSVLLIILALFFLVIPEGILNTSSKLIVMVVFIVIFTLTEVVYRSFFSYY